MGVLQVLMSVLSPPTLHLILCHAQQERRSLDTALFQRIPRVGSASHRKRLVREI